jgi:hypothetical protein
VPINQYTADTPFFRRIIVLLQTMSMSFQLPVYILRGIAVIRISLILAVKKPYAGAVSAEGTNTAKKGIFPATMFQEM